MTTPEDTLRAVFGHAAFRPGQLEAIRAFEAGHDVQLLMSTGGGKSACYQIPAIRNAHRGLTLVISPLIALMDDQVRGLRQRHIRAIAIHSGMSWDDVKAARDEAREAVLLYVSPERLKSKRFRSWLKELGIWACVVDEAHCISQWGHDFRKDYRNLSALREFGGPIMAATATATPRVMDDVAAVLGLRDPVRVVGGLGRPNLTWGIRHIQGDIARADRAAELAREAVADGGRAIIYAATRKRVKAVYDLTRRAIKGVDWYHAGRTPAVRQRVQDAFAGGKTRVLVCTNAFGMGVDLPDIRAVIHVDAPGTFEGWVQEAGRAGRDGLPARCELLYSPKDALTQARLRGGNPPPGAEEGWRELERVIFGTGCRERAILERFGAEGGACGRCDACVEPSQVAEQVRATQERLRKSRAQRKKKVAEDNAVELTAAQLDTVVAFMDGLKKPLGRRLVVKGLRGSNAKDVKRKKLVENPHFGALRGVPEVALFRGLDRLLDEGRLVPKGKKYPTIWIADKAVRGPRSTRPRAPKETGLAADLRSWRRRESRRRRLKPYQVFNDKTLTAIVAARPQTIGELGAVFGMGETRLRKYGQAILEMVRNSD